MVRVAIVADDLTGALDTAGQWARSALCTDVPLSTGAPPDTDAVAISTNSRALSAGQAYNRARQAAQRLQDRRVYKKVDSTLRGNIGSEVEGILDGLGLQRALVAPSFPAAGRTLQGGVLYIHGVPLARTERGHEPRPVRESHVPTLLATQTSRPVGHLALEIVAQGEDAIRRALQAGNAELVVADAVDMEHLHTLARAAAHLAPPWLCCGSAGLAGPWLQVLGWAHPAATPFTWRPQPGPVLVVAGSRHPAVIRQLRRAQAESNLHLIHLAREEDTSNAQRSRAQRLLAGGHPVAITIPSSPYRPGEEARPAAALGQAAAWICARSGVVGLILTGGDTAEAVCTALGMSGLHVMGEVEPGIPASTAAGGRWDGLRVVTKAGGFGDDLAIVHSIGFIQGL